MSDHPILFSAPMVRALLDGRKTQTRRVLNRARVFATPESRAFTLTGADMERALQNAERFRHMGEDGWFWEADAFEWQAPATRTGWLAHIGYAPGDRLWVREAWHAARSLDSTPPRDIPRDADIEHAATARSYAEIGLKGKLRPGMFLPRWASRLTLIVTDVRVQRVQDISENDARAEGALLPWTGSAGTAGDDTRTAQSEFNALWDTLNAKRGYAWDTNPWVTAVSFTVHRGNIDQVPS